MPSTFHHICPYLSIYLSLPRYISLIYLYLLLYLLFLSCLYVTQFPIYLICLPVYLLICQSTFLSINQRTNLYHLFIDNHEQMDEQLGGLHTDCPGIRNRADRFIVSDSNHCTTNPYISQSIYPSIYPSTCIPCITIYQSTSLFISAPVSLE